MLDEFGLTPEQRKQYLAEGRKELTINAMRNRYNAGFYIDPDDEELILRWKLLKEKVANKREELRQRAIARNNGLDTSPAVSETVLDTPRKSSGNFMAKVRRFMGL